MFTAVQMCVPYPFHCVYVVVDNYWTIAFAF